MATSDLFSPNRVADTGWRIAGSGDFNADGKPDLVWQHQTEGWLAVWLMNGRELISSELLTPQAVGDTNWKVVSINDFNADGKPDLVWQEQTQGWLGVWFMNGTTMTSSVALTPERVPDTNWKVVGSVDVDTDGKPDLVWQEPTEGYVAAWYMNGTTLRESVLLNPPGIRVRGWNVEAMTAFQDPGSSRPMLYWRDVSTGTLAMWTFLARGDGTYRVDSFELVPNRVEMLNWRIAGPK